MSSAPASYLLSFLLPPGARRDSGINVPSPFPCKVEVGRIGLVSILGPSRDAVFDQATRILIAACEGLPPLSVACKVYTPTPERLTDGRDWLDLGSAGAVDGWTIIVGAKVAFSPTGLDPHISALPEELPMRATLVADRK